MQIPIEPLNPPMVVALVATIVWGTAAIVLGLPVIRAWVRRIEKRTPPGLSADVAGRLERIEAAVDAIAVEVERISETQRYLAKRDQEKSLPANSDLH
jgi:hypothetical protein